MKPLLMRSRILAGIFSASVATAAPIERIWLTHGSNDPSRIVVNWETDQPAASIVEFGDLPSLGQRAAADEKVTLHHIEIPLAKMDAVYHYRVRSGEDASGVFAFKGSPTKRLRIANAPVVGVVLNQLDLDKAERYYGEYGGYGYRGYRKKGYAYGYGPQEK